MILKNGIKGKLLSWDDVSLTTSENDNFNVAYLFKSENPSCPDVKFVIPYVERLFIPDNINELIEKCGRVCYKSETKITKDSSSKFIENILSRKHESVIEHGTMSYKVICDRGVSHELVRHRLFSFSQESTRYVNYDAKGYQVILPCWMYSNKQSESNSIFFESTITSIYNYHMLLSKGWKPQQARNVLPNALKTEICMTANFRNWRHMLSLRCSEKAHPQAREIALLILKDCYKDIPIIFDDLALKYLKF
jgi:thymidylate synthase (FAD)